MLLPRWPKAIGRIDESSNDFVDILTFVKEIDFLRSKTTSDLMYYSYITVYLIPLF